MDSYYPDDSRSSDESGESCPRLPSRAGGAERAARHTEARAELRDRETYYIALRLAVHGQGRSVIRPRAALDDEEHQDIAADGGRRASGSRSADGDVGAGGKFSAGRATSSADEKIRSDGESWGDMTARFGDTWT